MYVVNLRFGWKLWWSILFSIMLIVGWAITPAQAHCKKPDHGDCDSGGGGGGGKPPKDDPPVQPNPVIVYTHASDFVVADEDGGNNTVVYNISFGSLNSASWCSLDGTDIVFDDEIDGISGVYLLKVVQEDAFGNRTPLVGKVPVLVTETNVIGGGSPQCSPVPVGPDGNKKIKVAFGDQGNLYLANVNEDGTSDPAPVLLLDGFERGLDQGTPSWSPLGDRIVFVSTLPGPWNDTPPPFYDIEVVDFHWDANTSNLIVDNPLSLIRGEPNSPLQSLDVFQGPSWSNSGDRIVVDSDIENGHGIWIIPLTNPTNAVPVVYDNMEVLRFDAAWSPDDSQLIYGRNPRTAMCGEDDGRKVRGNVGVVVSNVGGVLDPIGICDEVSIHTGHSPDWWRNAP